MKGCTVTPNQSWTRFHQNFMIMQTIKLTRKLMPELVFKSNIRSSIRFGKNYLTIFLSTYWSSNFPSKDWQKPNGQVKRNPLECLMPRSSHSYVRFTWKQPPQTNLYQACIQPVASNSIRK